jgi:N-methylhydantoinase A
MEGALRVVSLQRGYDPRRFTLLAFGGGGPLHACELAASLTIPKVMIPRFPGVLSALGMIMAPHFLEFSRTKKVMLDEADLPGIDSVFDSLRQKAVEEMGAREPLRYDYFLDMRYRGQAYDMTVPVKAMDLDRIKKDFISLHKRRYGYVRTEGDIEMVTFRLRAGRPPVKLSLQSGRRIRKASPAVARHQDVWWAENRSPLAVYSFPLIERDSLAPGVTLEGPALLLQYDCTTFVPPRWSGTVDRGENLILSNPDCGDREKME